MSQLYSLLIKYLYRDSVRYSKNPIIIKIRQTLSKFSPYNWRLIEKLKPDLPELATIDISSICNLNCPLCPTGSNTNKLEKGVMSLSDFKMYVDKMPSVTHLDLYNWGESFLNQQIFEMIDYAKSKNILVGIDSNLSFELSDYKLSRIINSGLNDLQVSLDGATAESYSKYRINGDFNLVFNNIKKLRQLQKERGNFSLKIVWKFIVHKYNEHEIALATKLAQEIDVKIFFDTIKLTDDIVDLNFSSNDILQDRMKQWLPADSKYIYKKYLPSNQVSAAVTNKKCPMLFKNIFVHSNGQVLPCCYVANEDSAMGNLKDQSLPEIWHNDKYLYARSLFYKGVKVKKASVACENCKLFSKPSDKAV